MTKKEIARKLGVSLAMLDDRLQGWFVPERENHYRMLEVLQVVPRRLCPVCLAPLTGKRDNVFCGGRCRVRARAALDEPAAKLAIGVPPLPIIVTGQQMAALREAAQKLGLSIESTARYLLAEGAGRIQGGA